MFYCNTVNNTFHTTGENITVFFCGWMLELPRRRSIGQPRSVKREVDYSFNMSMHAKEQGKLLETCSNDKSLSSHQTNVENTATNPGQSNNPENSDPPAARADEPSAPLVRSLRGQFASEHRPPRQRENSSRLRRDECRIELDLSRSELRVLPPTLFHPTDVLTVSRLASAKRRDWRRYSPHLPDWMWDRSTGEVD